LSGSPFKPPALPGVSDSKKRLFIKYSNKDFPPAEHKKQIMKMFTYEFLSINGLKLTTK
jgi:hypothetical protein